MSSTEDSKWTVYVLQCENGNYFIGKTRTSHYGGYGTWCILHKPLFVVTTIYNQSFPGDYEHITRQYMTKYGIDHVRNGDGKYSTIYLNEETIKQVAFDACYICGNTKHTSTYCPELAKVKSLDAE